MKYKNKIKSVLFFSLAVIVALGFTMFYKADAAGDQNYVRGKYGKYCYEIKNAPKSIKYFEYYRTLDDCTASIK